MYKFHAFFHTYTSLNIPQLLILIRLYDAQLIRGSTEIYIHLEAKLFPELPSEYIVRRAVSVKGMMQLAAIGFTKFDEHNGIHLYRKPKEA